MRLLFVISFMCFGLSALSQPLENRRSAFLDYKIQKQQFEKNRKRILNDWLKTKKNKKQEDRLKQGSSRLRHEAKQKQLESLRKKAFLNYKKHYKAYQARQKHTLDHRLKELNLIRKKSKWIKDPGFEFLKSHLNR